VIGYQNFGGPCCLHIPSLPPGDGGSMDTRNVGNLPQLYMAPQPRRPKLDPVYKIIEEKVKKM